MQWLYRVVGQAGIFLICAQTIVHFRPKESYEKYLKLLLSVMLLIQLLQPVLTMLGSRGDPGVEEQTVEFTEELQSVFIRASEQAGQAEGEIQNTANAIAQKAEGGQEAAEEAVIAQEVQELGEIRVEVGPIELE